MTSISKDSEIIETLKEKLNLPLDEAKKIFESIQDKLPVDVQQEEILKVVTTYITKNPIKSVAIALAIGFILAKMSQSKQ